MGLLAIGKPLLPLADHPRIRGALLARWRLPGFPLTYAEDGLYTNHLTPFLEDSVFLAGLERARAAGGEPWARRWRLHVLMWAAGSAKRVPGDFVELGTYMGAGAAAVLPFAEGRTFWLCDAFEDYRGRGDFYRDVADTFAPHPNVRLVKGRLPDSLPPIEQIAYLHVDCGRPEPEVASLEILWPKLSPGAVVILNAYAYPGFEPCHRALAGFFADRAPVLACPTGQGVVIR